jgi:Mg2+ and Co2+ transporter CorA
MAAGINTNKLHKLMMDLLGYIESINALEERLGTCKLNIQSNMNGAAKSEIINKLDTIIEQIPNVNTNINNYISVLSNVLNNYEQQDNDLASDVINNINKLGQ